MIDHGNDHISRMLKTAIKGDTKVFYAVFWARVYVLRSQKLLEDAGIELCSSPCLYLCMNMPDSFFPLNTSNGWLVKQALSQVKYLMLHQLEHRSDRSLLSALIVHVEKKLANHIALGIDSVGPTCRLVFW